MIKVDFLVVGQGIAGTLISYELFRRGRSFVVIDNELPNAASRVAGAVINPAVLKGRERFDKNEIIQTAITTYQGIADLLQCNILSQKSMVVFPDSDKEDGYYRLRVTENERYFFNLDSVDPEILLPFRYNYVPFSVHPVWQVDASGLLSSWKDFLKAKACYIKGYFPFDWANFKAEHFEFQNFQAKRIIFCEGVAARQNVLFSDLPFVPNRGDILRLKIPGLNNSMIYHRKMRLIPKGDDQFWFGSNYTWKYQNLLPDNKWRLSAENELNQWLRLPYTVISHEVAERPTTAGQVPISTFHDEYSRLIIFNGLGTRGFTFGPALASQLADMVCGS